jgi:hypothetical protein
VALSRGTQANHLYYSGEPPPDEDHHAAVVEEPRFSGLVAAVGRSRAQVLALDLLQGLDTMPRSTGSAASDWMEAPMTEAQVGLLARHGVVLERDVSWVQASLLIDDAMHTPRGEQAAVWLRENGASPEQAAQIIERAEQDLREPSDGRLPGAVAGRMETLEIAARESSRVPEGQAREREMLQQSQENAARDRQRQRRRARAQQALVPDGRAATAALDRERRYAAPTSRIP